VAHFETGGSKIRVVRSLDVVVYDACGMSWFLSGDLLATEPELLRVTDGRGFNLLHLTCCVPWG
jgi:hypothetical protein